jgi:hypothetical protein
MSFKLKKKVGITLALDHLMDDDNNFTFEFSLLGSNIKKEVCGVFDYFLSFLKRNDERKIHNMFLLMLYSQFMNFRFMSSFVGHEQGISILEVCDKKSLHLTFLKCYHCLYPMPNYEIGFVGQKVDEDYNME